MAGNFISLNLNQTLLWMVRNFPDNVYNFDPNDNLTNLMNILLGNAGTGQLSALQVAARINQQNVEFSDLDNILGSILKTTRLPKEIYTIDTNPFIDQLTPDYWDEVLTKDANYRERLGGVASSYLRGATPMGIQSIAEANTGLKFRVVELWNTVLSGSTISGTNINTTGFGNNCSVLIPLVPADLTFSNSTRIGTLQSVANLKPTGSIVSIASGVNPFVQAPYVQVSGTNTFTTSGTYTIVSGNSQYFTFQRTVTANNINVPSFVNNNNNLSITGRYWLRNSQPIVAPQLAHLQTQEALIDMTQNVSTTIVTPISTIGTIDSFSIKNPIGNSSLPITSTVYGAQ